METPEIIDSPIADFFKNKVVFITGGLGFVGKLLIEKLLRYDVKKIYIMARSKKGKTIEERLEALCNEPIFINLAKDKERHFSKLKVIYGDLQKLQLGMAPIDERLLIDEVEIFYHCAADVRFDENLKEAIETNVRGTREIIKLAQRLKTLNVFVYVSTAFCTPSFNVKEKFYDSTIDPNMMIKYVENLKSQEDIDKFEIFARRLIRPFPNTYTFTKSLAEQMIRKYAGNLNCAIIRPAIITVTYDEPIEGFADNIYGLNGVLAGAGAGVLRIVCIRNDFKANIVPADYTINLIMAISLYTMTLENNFNFIRCTETENNRVQLDDDDDDEFHLNEVNDDKIKVYNFSSSDENQVTWGDVKRITTSLGHKNPIKRHLWIITYNTTPYRLIARILNIFYHFIPALFFDLILIFRKKQPKLLKLYRKVNKFTEVIEFFTNNQWHFDDDNVIRLWNTMTPHDKKLFKFNLWSIEWHHFFELYVKGIRKYIYKEDEDTLEVARKRYRRITIIHYLMLFAICASLFYGAYKILMLYVISHDLIDNFILRTRFTYLKYDDME
ncbi:hypothetical protein PVAND_008967 [Polypedilum vanderplanki]|uniref:Fatty acyl-CoA reductase n=1 Tax=Polypedilum vanderplanki TaxID=319348 RepID=A0A9J6CBM7_POLVA|nr:hypothetical protein PVAND_008967 [Polypedilum vanderplanki]